MIAPLLSMQSMALNNINMAQANMMNASAINFRASQPLRPSFTQASDTFEMQTRANETKVTVAQKLLEAYEKALGKNIERSTPKFGGLDYKA